MSTFWNARAFHGIHKLSNAKKWVCVKVMCFSKSNLTWRDRVGKYVFVFLDQTCYKYKLLQTEYKNKRFAKLKTQNDHAYI